ncbi:MAG TPA: class I SAM-dependent methyltransferase, partial [Candidatus Hydrogenedentes bacterium]|nr:class I SAM-dependent methyltransferase [Candidatus Hydrogenedentota bacterium]
MGRIARFLGYMRMCCGIFLTRWRGHSGLAAWVFARHTLNNLWLRQRNRFSRRPRVECPCCGWTGYEFYSVEGCTWLVYGRVCPGCGSSERHRAFQLYIDRCAEPFGRAVGPVLHFAPERAVSTLLRRHSVTHHMGCDIEWEAVRQAEAPGCVADIQRLPFKNASIGLLICLHVLEHVPNDRRAIGEVRRVLKPGGQAYIMVPIAFHLERTEEWEAPDPGRFGHYRDYAFDDFRALLEGMQPEAIMREDFL